MNPRGESEGCESGNKKISSSKEKVGKGNVKTRECKDKGVVQTESEKKYSNHIEFVDYIPTHEVVTYRHLFAYGFYIV